MLIRTSVLLVVSLSSLGSFSTLGAIDKKQTYANNNVTTKVLEVIEVVAQKRSENIQQVPVSITAIAPEAIQAAGYQQITDLSDLVPNMRMTITNDFTSIISLRGVGAASRNIGFDSRVGLYLDGVYIGQSPANNQDIFDLERIEVLRGPQGTLFGKNNVAGAVHLISKLPENEFFANVGVGFGNYGAKQYKLVVNSPLSKTAALKVSFNDYQRDGLVTNKVTGNKINEQDNYSYRIQLSGQLTDNLFAHFAVDQLKSDRLSFDGDAITDTLGRLLNTQSPERDVVSLTIDPREERDISGEILTLDWQLKSGFSVKSITGHRSSEINYVNDFDFSAQEYAYFNYLDNYDQWSQEIQLISPKGKFQYIAGLYYYQQDAFTHREPTAQDDLITLFTGVDRALIEYGASLGDPQSQQLLAGFNPGVLTSKGTVDTTSYAAFFNSQYYFNDKLSLGLGFRYSDEKKQVDWQVSSIEQGTGVPIVPALGLATGTVKDTDSYHDFSPLVSLNYQINSKNNAYIKYATGYKSGGFNLDFLTQDQLDAGIDFDKETVTTIEAGVKGYALDSRLSYRSAIFSSQYDDFQVNQLVKLDSGTTAFSVRNAAKVDTKGLELETSYVYQQWQFDAWLALLDASFDEFKNGGVNGEDLSGNSLPEVSDYSFRVGVKYFYPVDWLKGEVVFSADYQYRDDYNSDLDSTTEITLADGNTLAVGHIDGYGIANANVVFAPYSDKYNVTFWLKNLADENSPVMLGKKSFFGARRNVYVNPRMYGVNLTYHF